MNKTDILNKYTAEQILNRYEEMSEHYQALLKTKEQEIDTLKEQIRVLKMKPLNNLDKVILRNIQNASPCISGYYSAGELTVGTRWDIYEIGEYLHDMQDRGIILLNGTRETRFGTEFAVEVMPSA